MHKIWFSSVKTSVLSVRAMGLFIPIPVKASPFFAKRIWNGGLRRSLSNQLIGIMVFNEARL